MPGLGRRCLDGGLLQALAAADVEAIHGGALRILAGTGVVVHDAKVLSLLAGAGCRVTGEDRRAYLPADVVEGAVGLAPGEVTLYDRLGAGAMALGSGRSHVRVSSGATGILDLDDARRRPATGQDAADAARLADALPHIDGMSTMAVQPADVPANRVDVHALRLALANTVKPLGYVCLNEELLEPAIAMAAVVAGGEDALRRRPFLTALAESTSPLQLVSSQLAVLRAFAGRGLPLTLHAHPMAGFTAPVMLAGTLVVTHAEVLALVTIAQLIRPGTPVVYGMSSSVPDMRSGMNLSGAVEIGLMGTALAQLAGRCGLPCVLSSGSDAHSPGAQSVLERLLTLLPPVLAGVDLVNLSTLDTKMSFSLEQLVLDDLIASLVARYLRGIAVDPESLAVSVIDEVGPGGAFVTVDHTLRHFRSELLVPDLLDRGGRSVWEQAGGPDLPARARERVRRILAEHRPPPLSDQVAWQLDEIVASA
ncbi:MAG: trimethylamine methyltransferase family protein [Anaerolineae bacterium]